jgi:protein-tyrosine phosphatase
VDDGARTVEEALEGVDQFREAGFRTVVTTPHLEGSATRTLEGLDERLQPVDRAWETLRVAVAEGFPDMELHRGHEIMLDVPDPDFSDPRVRLAETPNVLVEWPRLQVPPGTKPVLSRIRDEGYGVILAHPERYRGMDPDLMIPGEWRELGARLQVNYGSLLGKYGEEPRKRALVLLERGWVDLLATDFHARPHLSLNLEQARETMAILGGMEHFEILARWNPARILEGEELFPVPPLPRRKGVWERIREFLSGTEG